MGFNITDGMNALNEMGVFSYVIPFLLIFAIVFAILDKTKLLSRDDNDNKGITAIIAVAVGLLALQFDIVSTFFATIFPRLGVGISIFLCFIILVGFFLPAPQAGKGLGGQWIGWVIFAGVIIWSLSSWLSFSGSSGFGGWFSEYIWAIVVLGVVVALIILVSKGKRGGGDEKGK